MGSGRRGKVFVQFLDGEGATKAMRVLDGRLFAGNKVRLTYLQPQEFMDAVASG